jgi:hypothetical protein
VKKRRIWKTPRNTKSECEIARDSATLPSFTNLVRPKTLKDTTEQNLKNAFSGESQAHMR